MIEPGPAMQVRKTRGEISLIPLLKWLQTHNTHYPKNLPQATKWKWTFAQNNAGNALKLQPQAPLLIPKNTHKGFGPIPSPN